MATLRVAIDASQASMGAAEWERSTLRVVTGANNVHSAVVRMLGVFAGGGAMFMAVDAMKKYEFTMASLRGVTGATAAEMTKFDKVARQLGASTKFGASQAAEAMLAFSKAGLSVNEALGATPAALTLATAHAFELDEAAEIVANTMRQFGMSAKDAERIIDDLSVTANLSTIDVRDLAGSLKFAGGLAHTAGLQIEEVNAAIGVLGNVGIKRFLAGTNLRGIMSTLMDPTPPPQSVDALASLGLTKDDVDLRKQSLESVFTKLRDAGLGVQTALQLFRRENANAALALSRHIDQLQMFVDKQHEGQGSTKELANIMNDTLVGSLAHTKNSFESLFITLGGKSDQHGLIGSLRSLLDTTADVALYMAGMDTGFKGSQKNAESLARTIQFGLAFALTAYLIPALDRAILSIGTMSAAFARTPLGMITLGAAAVAGTVAGYGDKISMGTGSKGQDLTADKVVPSWLSNEWTDFTANLNVMRASLVAVAEQKDNLLFHNYNAGLENIREARWKAAVDSYGSEDMAYAKAGGAWGVPSWVASKYGAQKQGRGLSPLDQALNSVDKDTSAQLDAAYYKKVMDEFDIESHRAGMSQRDEEAKYFYDADHPPEEKEFDSGLRIKQRMQDMVTALKDEREALMMTAEQIDKVKQLRQAESFMLEHRIADGGVFLAQLAEEIELTQQAKLADSIKQKVLALNEEYNQLGMTNEQVARATEWNEAYTAAMQANTQEGWDNLAMLEATQADNAGAKLTQWLKDRAKALGEETALLGRSTRQRLIDVAAREAEAKAISLGVSAEEKSLAVKKAIADQTGANQADGRNWRDEEVKTLLEERELIGLTNGLRDLAVRKREAEKQALDSSQPSREAFVKSLVDEFEINQRLQGESWFRDRIKNLQQENGLINLGNEAREITVALLEAEAEARDKGMTDYQKLLDSMRKELVLGAQLRGYKWEREDLEALEEERKLIFMTNEERELAIKLNEANRNAKDHGIAPDTKAYTVLIEQMQRMRELKNLADAVGASFSNALADLIVNGNRANDVLKGLVMTVYRLVFDQTVGAPMAKLISSGITSLFGGMVAGERGMVLGGGTMTPFASGGALMTSPTMLSMGGGRRALAAEHGPGEALFPLKRMGDGRLGLSAEVGGGNQGARPIVVQMTVIAKDADSFRRSASQVGAAASRAISAATRTN